MNKRKLDDEDEEKDDAVAASLMMRSLDFGRSPQNVAAGAHDKTENTVRRSRSKYEYDDEKKEWELDEHFV
ncbi:unnamed protein product [Caenorhabditis bovis]|uniref:Uncharacterized protein n=1 Tax=Caenorhabditis bovis TaxID=2654633 RepID=A0A8S1FG82_9PELO|nr:unnamed protein product [Caenorhabditis bovis]